MMKSKVKNIPLSKITIDEGFNCRKRKISPNSILELAESIAQHGLIQNLVVELLEGKYVLRCGHRRFSALKYNKAKDAACTVFEGLNAKSRRHLNLLENIQREDLTVVEEALAIEHLFLAGDTESSVMAALDKNRGWVQYRKMIGSLPHVLHESIVAKVISRENVQTLYSHYIEFGDNDEFWAKVRWVKDQHASGAKSASLRVLKEEEDRVKTARVRSRPEILVMLSKVQGLESADSLAAKVLAWAAGNISGVELQSDLTKIENANSGGGSDVEQ